MHHDLGALGIAAHPRAIERQVEILQSMGANAIRTSHNPPAPELLDVCDRLGMLVMDEAFDCWRRGKKRDEGAPESANDARYFDYARVFDDWHERDLRALVRRDRNHPSVVMWSIGNEVIEQWFSDGYELAQRLAGIVREEDRTRPTTERVQQRSGRLHRLRTSGRRRRVQLQARRVPRLSRTPSDHSDAREPRPLRRSARAANTSFPSSPRTSSTAA